MSSHAIPLYETSFYTEDDSYDNASNSETLEDTFDLLVDDAQTNISSEENRLNEFFEDDYEEVESFEPLYSIAPEMTFTNWKKLDE